MRILVVTPYYAPDLGPSAPLLALLSEQLAANGHQMTVLAAAPHFPSGQVDPCYRPRPWQRGTRNGVQVFRVWVPSGDRSNLVHRLLTFVAFQILVSLIGLCLKYDAILITNPALETALPFALLAWLRRKPSIFCVWDLYPEVGMQLGIFRHPAVIGLVKAMEDFCLRRTQAVQALAEGFVPNLARRVSSTTILEVISPWVDTELIRPMPRSNSFSVEHDLDDVFVVLYAGNLGLSQGLATVLEAARALADRPEIAFVFVGDGAGKERLMGQAQAWGLPNVRFLPFQPRARLPEVLASADVSLVVLRLGLSSGSLPSKTFSILASGRPVLASVDGQNDVRRLVQRAQAGIVVPLEVAVIAHALAQLLHSGKQRKLLGAKAAQLARERFDPRHVALQMIGQFEQTISAAPQTTKRFPRV